MQRESRIAASRVRGKFSELRTHIGGACPKAIYALKRCRFLCCLCRCQVKGTLPQTQKEAEKDAQAGQTDRQQGKQTRLLIKRSSDFKVSLAQVKELFWYVSQCGSLDSKQVSTLQHKKMKERERERQRGQSVPLWGRLINSNQMHSLIPRKTSALSFPFHFPISHLPYPALPCPAKHTESLRQINEAASKSNSKSPHNHS